MSTRAFHTRRVLESLTALSGYLEQAVETADGIPPGEVPKVFLPDPPPVSVSPRLLSVLFDGSRKVTLPNEHTGDDGKTTLELVVSGDDLQNHEKFKLVRVGADASPIEATITNASPAGDRFTATVTFPAPEDAAGLYDAKFVNTAGQQDVLNRAIRVKKATDDGGNGNGSGNGSGGGVEVEAKATKKGRATKD
jgi:hypothetical protein